MWCDTFPGFEGRFQVHLINIILYKTHATESAFQHRSTATMTETNNMKQVEFPELSAFCWGKNYFTMLWGGFC